MFVVFPVVDVSSQHSISLKEILPGLKRLHVHLDLRKLLRLLRKAGPVRRQGAKGPRLPGCLTVCILQLVTQLSTCQSLRVHMVWAGVP